MNELEPIEERLQGSINKDITSELRVHTGGLVWASMAQVLEFSKLMALSRVAVPAHLRNNPGACLGIVTQAINWEMDPFTVANKSYEVSGRLAYEAQLINAVILRRAPIVGRFNIAYSGDGERRRCTVSAHLKEGGILAYESPEIGRIPKNSPLWKSDPDQQLFYYSSRAFCRRHFPDVLLGVYSRDELEDNIAPLPKKSLADKLTAAISKSRVNDIVGIKEMEPEQPYEQAPSDYAEPPRPGDGSPDGGTVEMDGETANIKLAGMLAARNGQREFKKWWGRLSAQDVERVEPYMEELHAILAEKAGDA